MAAARALVPIRGKQVLFEEGDLVVSTSSGLRNDFLVLLNHGVGAHAATVVRHRGELVCVSVCPFPWTDETGREWPGGGLTREPCALYGDKAYRHLVIYRPRVPRTPEQIAALRLAVADVFRKYGTDTPCYDGWKEFFTSGMNNLFEWKRYSTDKWHCGEFCAWLLRVQGLWPEGHSVSVHLGDLCRIAGKPDPIF